MSLTYSSAFNHCMALNGLLCADVPLRTYTPPLIIKLQHNTARCWSVLAKQTEVVNEESTAKCSKIHCCIGLPFYCEIVRPSSVVFLLTDLYCVTVLSVLSLTSYCMSFVCMFMPRCSVVLWATLPELNWLNDWFDFSEFPLNLCVQVKLYNGNMCA